MVYVGLTNNIKRRDRDHLFSEKEALSIYCIENDIPLPKPIILEKDIDAKTAQKQEKYWIDYYKNNGWEMFNIAKPGSLGRFTIKWTKPKLQKEADKYETRAEFRKKNPTASNAARSKKLMDKLFKNHTNQGRTINPDGYWTKERLQEEANKYETRGEFLKKDRKSYMASYRLNLVDELFKNHPNKGYIGKHLDNERLQDEVNKYKTRAEFRKNNAPAYGTAKRRKLLDELFKNQPNLGYSTKQKPTGYYSKERLQKEVDKYKTRMNFKKNNYNAYSQVVAKKLLDELFKNHPNQGYKNKRK